MVTIVFALAVANLGLGFALAVVLDCLPVWSTFPFNGQFRTGSPTEFDAAENAENGMDRRPQDEWSQKLRDAEVDPGSAIERLLWIVKLETEWRCERLVELDRVSRDEHSSQPIETSLSQELASFHQLLELWIALAGAERNKLE